MSVVFDRPGLNGAMLLCLDAVSLAADSDPGHAPAETDWSGNAALLLSHAREQGWAVGHVISRRPRPGEAPWRPLTALGPDPSEPVYHREHPSAFSSPELYRTLTEGPRAEVVLCGVSAHGSALATALDALRLGVRLTIAGDAAWLPPGERDGLEGLFQLQRMGLTHGGVRLSATQALLRPWRRLRVVQGGRS